MYSLRPAAKKTGWISLCMILSLVVSQPAFSVGDQLIEAVMRSDFVFDRGNSNIPFFPLSYLTISQQNALKLTEGCQLIDCEFDYQNISQGFGLPVWVGKKNMLILGESLEHDKLELDTSSVEINTAGLLAAWVMQPSEQWQLASFLYHYQGIGDDSFAKEPKGNIFGLVGRYRHTQHFHSYWGVVRFDEYNDESLYPYAGFDWYFGRQWSVSVVIPWPTVNYSPDNENIIKFGALFSGGEWVLEEQGELLNNDFDKLDFGLSYEHNLTGMIWAGASLGYSGFGKLAIRSDADIEFESDVSGSPFVKLSLNFRPK